MLSQTPGLPRLNVIMHYQESDMRLLHVFLRCLDVTGWLVGGGGCDVNTLGFGIADGIRLWDHDVCAQLHTQSRPAHRHGFANAARHL